MPPAEHPRFWAHELGGMAKTGLLYAHDRYNTDRCLRMLAIAEAMAAMTIGVDFRPERPYLPDAGILTPKVGCTVAAFDGGGRAVVIQRADDQRWALPGGYAEIGSTPAANGRREFREETGSEAKLEQLVGVYDNTRFASVSPHQFSICLFRARIAGAAPATSPETLAVRLVRPDDPPEKMSALQLAMLRDAAHPPAGAVYQ